MKRVGQQIRHHSVALISLAIALSSLAYNTWRNEETEANRNIRTAGIQLLLQLGELDQVVFFTHYDKDAMRGNPREGWAIVLMIRDLGTLTPSPAAESCADLFAAWQADWSGLGSDNEAAARISGAIDEARDATRTVLLALD